jgi:hypothetical protein
MCGHEFVPAWLIAESWGLPAIMKNLEEGFSQWVTEFEEDYHLDLVKTFPPGTAIEVSRMPMTLRREVEKFAAAGRAIMEHPGVNGVFFNRLVCGTARLQPIGLCRFDIIQRLLFKYSRLSKAVERAFCEMQMAQAVPN